MIGQSIGKYRVIRQIGAGGMGVVFEAVHETIGQRVAIKLLHPEHSARRDRGSRSTSAGGCGPRSGWWPPGQ